MRGAACHGQSDLTGPMGRCGQGPGDCCETLTPSTRDVGNGVGRGSGKSPETCGTCAGAGARAAGEDLMVMSQQCTVASLWDGQRCPQVKVE